MDQLGSTLLSLQADAVTHASYSSKITERNLTTIITCAVSFYVKQVQVLHFACCHRPTACSLLVRVPFTDSHVAMRQRRLFLVEIIILTAETAVAQRNYAHAFTHIKNRALTRRVDVGP